MVYQIQRTADGEALQKTFHAAVSSSSSDASGLGRVACYPWGGSYRPEMLFMIGWNETAIYAVLRTYESNPRAIVTEPNGRVWCDSCMEFFLSPSADLSAGYFNFEMNANAALLLHFGLNPQSREEVTWLPHDLQGMGAAAAVRAVSGNDRGRDYWQLLLTAPVSMIARYVQGFQPASGAAVRANVYKCGDETAAAHFGCFYPIDAEAVREPNFHVPAYFGKMVFE